MKNSKWIVGAIVAAVVLNGGLQVLNIWLSPTGRVLDSAIFAWRYAQLFGAILLILSLFQQTTKGEDLSDRWRQIYSAAAVFAVAALISIPIGNRLAQPIRQRGFEAFVAENRFLIDAVEAYTAEQGEPPESLEDLYPVYLDESVATMAQEETIDGFKDKLEIDVSYDSIDEGSAEQVLYSFEPAEDSDPWELKVSIYLGSFKSNRFVYNPEEAYSNRHTPVGRWGLTSSR